MVTAETLLGVLPVFKDKWVTVKKNQRVNDIIEQLLSAHKKYAGYYDEIALYFDADNVEKICEKLYKFCKREILYREESENDQTTAVPQGILSRGEGDCKHYASFCGGVLDALSRVAGKKIDWCYRFVSYNVLSKSPHHVFVVVFDGDKEIWIDPVPGANDLEPTWQLDKKINATMPLRDNIGSVKNNSSCNENSYNIIGAALVLPDHVSLLSKYFELVQTQVDIDDNNKVIEIVRADHEQYVPTLGQDENLTTFLWLIKLTIMSTFGVKIRPVWDAGHLAISNKWQYEFAPWLQQYYPKEWQLYLDAWNEYSRYSIKVIYERYAPVINAGMSFIDKLFKQFTGVSIKSELLPTSLPADLPEQVPVPVSVKSSLIVPVLAGLVTYAITKKPVAAVVVGVGAYLIIKPALTDLTTTQPVPVVTTTQPVVNQKEIFDFLNRYT